MAQFHTNPSGAVDPATPGPHTDHTPPSSSPMGSDKNSRYNSGVRTFIKSELQNGFPVGQGSVDQLKGMR